MATAQKRKLLSAEHAALLVKQLTTLNKIGEHLGKIEGVHAMTDITGFGVLGHLIEMTEGSKLSADLYYDRLRMVSGIQDYLAQKVVPDSTRRNWDSYGYKVVVDAAIDTQDIYDILPDPQTNGGLLVSVSPDATEVVEALFKEYGLDDFCVPVGRMTDEREKTVYVMKGPSK